MLTRASPNRERMSLNMPLMEPKLLSMEQMTTTEMKWGM